MSDPNKELEARQALKLLKNAREIATVVSFLRSLDYSEVRIQSLLFAAGHGKKKVREIMAKKERKTK
jgi:hypothetical protein